MLFNNRFIKSNKLIKLLILLYVVIIFVFVSKHYLNDTTKRLHLTTNYLEQTRIRNFELKRFIENCMRFGINVLYIRVIHNLTIFC